jgi:NADH-quinone oxidoreductase subunit K
LGGRLEGRPLARQRLRPSFETRPEGRSSGWGPKWRRRRIIDHCEAKMTIGLGHYLVVAAILFTLGIFGIFLNRKNVIVILMSIELILLAVNINLVAFSANLGDLVGQVFALFVLTVAAAEAAIGLAILVVFFRNRGSIAVEDINLMKG